MSPPQYAEADPPDRDCVVPDQSQRLDIDNLLNPKPFFPWLPPLIFDTARSPRQSQREPTRKGELR